MKRTQGIGSIMILALLFAGSLPAWSQTAWKTAFNGVWSDSANWTNGVPNNNDATLGLGSGSYTVTVDAPLVDPFRSLTLTNIAAYQTTLDIGATGFVSATGQFTIGRSGVVNVNSGGEWTYTGTNASGNPMFLIKDGGRLNIAGGSLLLTNLVYSGAGRSYIYVGDGSDGALYVSAGRLEYWGRPPNANGTHQLIVGRPGGAGYMEVSGGRVVLGQPAAGQAPMYVGSGAGSTGTLVISGGELVMTNTDWNSFQVGSGGGYGRMIVTNTGYFSGGGRSYIGTGNGSTGSLSVYASTLKAGSLYIGDMNGAGQATGFAQVIGGRVLADAVYVGSALNGGTALGTLIISGGALPASGSYGAIIGRGRAGGIGKGFVVVTGGSFNVTATFNIGYGVNLFPVNGLVLGSVGANGIDELDATTRAFGKLDISGGTITNEGNFVVGVCGGTGVVVQTGGRIVEPGGGGKYTIIGYGAGTNTLTGRGVGTYEMSGGVFNTPAPAFVGGVPPVVPGEATNTTWYSKAGAVGLLKVTGGSFAVSNTLYVGGYGAGTLTLGSNGLVRCNDLVLSNNTASTLRFELAPNGAVGQLVVTNKLTIAPGSKLELYVPRSYIPDVPVKVLTLATYATNAGAFANPADITVSNYPGVTVIQTTTNIQVRIPSRQGTMILIR